MAEKDFKRNALAPTVPVSCSIVTALNLDNIGTTGAVVSQGAAKFDLEQDASDYHEGLVVFQVKTTNGQGGTPTSPGASKTVTLHYAFCSDSLTASDGPALLVNLSTALVCTLPDSSSSAVAGQIYKASAPVVVTGRYLYVWYDRDAFAANALIDVVVKVVRV